MTYENVANNLIYLFSLFVCYLFIVLISTGNINLIYEISEISFSGVYFAPIVVSEHNLTRIGTEYKVWGNNIKFFSKESVFIPVATFSLNKTFPKTVVYSPLKKTKKVHRLIYGFKEAMLDFYHNSTLDWFFRLTDDVYVNMNNFATFINNLEDKYNPKEQAIIKGHLCATYLHGGSGWIMSRRGVELVLNVWNEVELPEAPDDVIAPKLWEKAGLDTRQMHSEQFLGSRTNDDYLVIGDSKIGKQLPSCGSNMMSRISKLAVWHAGSNSMSIVVHGDEIMRKVPNNVYYNLFDDGTIGFCINNRASNFPW